MALGQGVLKGKKTYVAAGLSAIGFIGAYLMGDITLAALMQGILTSVLGVTLRHGIKNEMEK